MSYTCCFKRSTLQCVMKLSFLISTILHFIVLNISKLLFYHLFLLETALFDKTAEATLHVITDHWKSQ